MIGRIKKRLPVWFKRFGKRNFYRLIKPFGKRVFCISVQKNGTTSVGDFLEDHGYRVAGQGVANFHKWPYLYFMGDYESIFKTNAFKAYNAFQDSPWYFGDFYRVLFHRFPKSKFVMLYRDSDAWFDSMLKYSNGKVLGNTYRHCKNYRRLTDFYNKLDNDPDFHPTLHETDNLMSLKGKREHYIQIYEEYIREVKEFFNRYGADRIFIGKLEDPEKWQKIGNFLDIQVDKSYDVHSNKSETELSTILGE